MTALHWAAHHGDAGLVDLLLKQDASCVMSANDTTPVDIAGIAGHKQVVDVFCQHLVSTILKACRPAENIPTKRR